MGEKKERKTRKCHSHTYPQLPFPTATQESSSLCPCPWMDSPYDEQLYDKFVCEAAPWWSTPKTGPDPPTVTPPLLLHTEMRDRASPALLCQPSMFVFTLGDFLEMQFTLGITDDWESYEKSHMKPRVIFSTLFFYKSPLSTKCLS